MAERKPKHEQRFKRTDWSKEPSAQNDPLRNPDGLYSGMTKRVAIEDGLFVDVSHAKPPSGRKD